MALSLSKQEEAFRQDAISFLDRNLTQKMHGAAAKGTSILTDFDLASLQCKAERAGVDVTDQHIISGISDRTRDAAAPSALKLMESEVNQSLDERALESIGLHRHVDYLSSRETRTDWAAGPNYAIPLVGSYLKNRASTNYGGSSEVQRNIMSRVLFGL